MKKNSLFITVLICCFFVFSAYKSFAFSRQRQEKSTIKGYVRVYGSVPHIFLGITTEDEKKYALQCNNKKTEQKLSGEQGILIICTGTVLSADQERQLPLESLEDGVFILDNWKPAGLKKKLQTF